MNQLKGLLNNSWRIVEALAVVTSVIAFFVLFGYPDGLIIGLALIVVFLLYVIWAHVDPDHKPADQERLDDLLCILNRQAEEAIAQEDFYATWNVRIRHPVRVFVESRYAAEHHFRDQRLEVKRKALMSAAVRFLHEEAIHGFPPKGWGTSSDRVSGYSMSESEGFPEREAIVEQHRAAIYPAACEFVDAHAALVATAISANYDVSALSNDRHPAVLRWDAIYDER